MNASMNRIKCMFRTMWIVFWCLLLWLVNIATGTQAFAAITVQVEPTEVSLGETVRLTFTADTAGNDIVPDFSPLQKNFRIVATEKSMNYAFINGQSRSMTQWSLLLIPQRTGVLDIPALKIGTEESHPSRVKVTKKISSIDKTDNTTQSISKDDEVLLFSNVNKQRPYVGEQVLLTVKLYIRSRLLDAEYNPPTVENALMLPLGEADRYQTTQQGHTYIVEEQRYALFPQKSGELTIRGPSFHATSYEVVPRHINKRTKVVKLDVKPIPKSFTSKTWLPAKNVTLKDHYSTDNSNLLEGQTIERQVIVQATALPAQLLPTLEFTESQQFDVYPEKAEASNSLRQNELVGQTTTKVTYLLNKPGRITIPAIKLQWFNTVTNKQEEAILPERMLTVHAKQLTSDEHNPSNNQASISSSADSSRDVSSPKPMPINSQGPSTSLAWWFTALFGSAWVVTLVIWWQRGRVFKQKAKRRVMQRLKDACLKKKPYEARDALLAWAKLQWPDVRVLNLRDLERLIQDVTFKEELRKLTECLYSVNSKKQWDGGNRLWQFVVAYKPSSTKKNRHHDLPPMNP